MPGNKKTQVVPSSRVDAKLDPERPAPVSIDAAGDDDGVDSLDFSEARDDLGAVVAERVAPRSTVLDFDDIGAEIEQFFAASGQRWCLQREFDSFAAGY